MSEEYEELLGICGCGDPILAYQTIADVLEYHTIIKIKDVDFQEILEKQKDFLLDKFNCESVYDNGLLLTLIYILNDKGLLDHGTSVGASWITDEGIKCLKNIKKYIREEND